MSKTEIPWTQVTVNPFPGCWKVSPGCARCYAERRAKRLKTMGHKAYQDIVDENGWTGRLGCQLEQMRVPGRGKMVFVNSMGDLFYEGITDKQRDQVYAAIASQPRHCFQSLTKRPERALAYYQRLSEKGPVHQNLYISALIDYYSRHGVDLSRPYQTPSPPTPEVRFLYDSVTGVDPTSRLEDRPKDYCNHEYHWRPWPLDNLWLGVTVENQEWADQRIPILLRIPAAVRFVSLEPLLGPVDLTHVKWAKIDTSRWPFKVDEAWSTNNVLVSRPGDDLNKPKIGLDWVIVGCESGPKRRPCKLKWVESIVEQCRAAHLPVFVKQLDLDGKCERKIERFPKHLQIREWPSAVDGK